MPRRSNEYQRLVLSIYRALAGTAVQVEESVLVPEKNAASSREVDVLLTMHVGNHRLRVAIECRDHSSDQDITWIDSLIGKYANLDVQKVVAVSRTNFSVGAREKAAQHNIDLLTLNEAADAKWDSVFGAEVVRVLGLANRLLVAGLWNGEQLVTKTEFTFDGEMTTEGPGMRALGDFFVSVWEQHVSKVFEPQLCKFVFRDWERLAKEPTTLRYAEFDERFDRRHTLTLNGVESFQFDRVVWGVGSRYSLTESTPSRWRFADHRAVVAAARDLSGNSVELVLVAGADGRLCGLTVQPNN